MTHDEANSLLEQAELLVDSKQFRSALGAFRRIAEEAPEPGFRVLAIYNVGAINWGEVGNGEEGRRWFRRAVEAARAFPGGAHAEAVRRLHANACENLMLLSISFEEYEEWARQLEQLQPDNDILRGQRPHVRRAHEEGHPWSKTLLSFGQTYYNRGDPSKDVGRYGCGAATLHVMLTHRKQLRLSRDDWGVVIYEYGALVLRAASDCHLAATRAGLGADIGEYDYIVRGAVPFVEEYVQGNPADEVNGGLLNNMRKFLQGLEQEAASRQARVAAQPLPRPQRPASSPGLPPGMPGLPPGMPPPSPFAVLLAGTFTLGLIGAGVGWLVDWLSGTTYWALVGATVGAVLAVLLSMKVAGAIALGLQACVQCGRPFEFGRGHSPLIPGVMVNRAALAAGTEGVGRECQNCGQVVCSHCDQSAPCPCGGGRFRGVHLIYA